MPKNAWSLGGRFVALAALAIGASCAVTGAAAANDGGGEARTDCRKSVSAQLQGMKGSAVSTGCPKRKKKKKNRRADRPVRVDRTDRSTTPNHQRPRHRNEYGTLGRLLNGGALNLSRQGGGLPLADDFGLAASRGLTRQMPLRLDPTLSKVPGWSATRALAPLPAAAPTDSTILAGRVINAKDPQSAVKAEVTTQVRTVSETAEKITRSEFGELLSAADSGSLLGPASSVLGSAAGGTGVSGLPAIR